MNNVKVYEKFIVKTFTRCSLFVLKKIIKKTLKDFNHKWEDFIKKKKEDRYIFTYIKIIDEQVSSQITFRKNRNYFFGDKIFGINKTIPITFVKKKKKLFQLLKL